MLRRSPSALCSTALALTLGTACGSPSSPRQDASTATDATPDTGADADAASIDVPGDRAQPTADAGPPCGADAAVAAVISAMAPGSWRALPNTAMSAVCPLPYDHYLCEAVMSAWSGGAFDTTHDQLVVFGGGHSDSPYGTLFAFDLPSMTWRRWTDLPAGWTGDTHPAIFDDKRVETCGLYPRGDTLSIPDALLTSTGYVQPDHCDDPSIASQLDPQQPRSAHTYGNVAYSALTDRFYNLGSIGLWPSGQASSPRVMGFDFGTGAWVRGANNPQVTYGVSATDARGHIWYLGASNLLEYDPQTDVWTATASPTSGAYYGSADIDTRRNVLLVTVDGLALDTYALGEAGAPHAAATSTGLAAPLAHSAGLAYSSDLDRFVAWSGGRTVQFLDPATWRFTSFTATGDDPGTPSANGTFGRFRYSPRCGVFVGVNSTMTNVFLFRPPSAAP